MDRQKSKTEGWFYEGSFSRLIKQCMFCCLLSILFNTVWKEFNVNDKKLLFPSGPSVGTQLVSVYAESFVAQNYNSGTNDK